MKRLFIDVETAGLDKDKHDITQLSGIIDIDHKIVKTFDFKCKLSNDRSYESCALRVQNVGLEELINGRDRLSQPELFNKFLAILQKYIDPYDSKDKFRFIGYNSHIFDSQFIRKLFEENNNKYFGSYFWSPSIDVMLAVAFVLDESRKCLADFKLSTVAKYLGINVDSGRLHDSMYDVELTRDLYYMIKLMIN